MEENKNMENKYQQEEKTEKNYGPKFNTVNNKSSMNSYFSEKVGKFFTNLKIQKADILMKRRAYHLIFQNIEVKK